jgi:KUP system potassium uptake protein
MDRRVEVSPLGGGFWRVTVNYGFMNTPDVPKALELTRSHGLHVPVFETTFFLSRESVVPAPGWGLSSWRQRLFAALSRNASGVVEFFRLPANAVVELGTRVRI